MDDLFYESYIMHESIKHLNFIHTDEEHMPLKLYTKKCLCQQLFGTPFLNTANLMCISWDQHSQVSSLLMENNLIGVHIQSKVRRWSRKHAYGFRMAKVQLTLSSLECASIYCHLISVGTYSPRFMHSISCLNLQRSRYSIWLTFRFTLLLLHRIMGMFSLV